MEKIFQSKNNRASELSALGKIGNEQSQKGSAPLPALVLRISELIKFRLRLKNFSHPSVAVGSLILFNVACQAIGGLVMPLTPTVAIPTELLLPSQTSFTATPSPTMTNSPTASATLTSTPPQTSEVSGCENILAFRLLGLPEQAKDLFEHHAKGVFLILHLEAINLTQKPIQILSDDYTLIIPSDNTEIQLQPHKAATNYLYLVRDDSFYQDQIKPASIWRTYLAFDVPPQTTTWRLLLTPGAGNSRPLCQTTIIP